MKRNSVSQNLVYQRKLKGCTREELAGKTAVTVRTIQRIEKGDVQPHLQTIKLLATALEIEIDQILPLEVPLQEKVKQKWLLFLHASPILAYQEGRYLFGFPAPEYAHYSSERNTGKAQQSLDNFYD